eukprot:8005801-Alexandrium_andersonii.AAC.1
MLICRGTAILKQHCSKGSAEAQGAQSRGIAAIENRNGACSHEAETAHAKHVATPTPLLIYTG